MPITSSSNYDTSMSTSADSDTGSDHGSATVSSTGGELHNLQSAYQPYELNFAQSLGINLDSPMECQFLLPAAVAAMYRLPEGYEVCLGSDEFENLPFFFDTKLSESFWHHPLEAQIKAQLTSIVEEKHILAFDKSSDVSTITYKLYEVTFALSFGVDPSNADHRKYLIPIILDNLYKLPEGFHLYLGKGEYENVPFFHNNNTGESVWNHPYEELIQKQLDMAVILYRLQYLDEAEVDELAEEASKISNLPKMPTLQEVNEDISRVSSNDESPTMRKSFSVTVKPLETESRSGSIPVSPIRVQPFSPDALSFNSPSSSLITDNSSYYIGDEMIPDNTQNLGTISNLSSVIFGHDSGSVESTTTKTDNIDGSISNLIAVTTTAVDNTAIMIAEEKSTSILKPASAGKLGKNRPTSSRKISFEEPQKPVPPIGTGIGSNATNSHSNSDSEEKLILKSHSDDFESLPLSLLESLDENNAVGAIAREDSTSSSTVPSLQLGYAAKRLSINANLATEAAEGKVVNVGVGVKQQVDTPGTNRSDTSVSSYVSYGSSDSYSSYTGYTSSRANTSRDDFNLILSARSKRNLLRSAGSAAGNESSTPPDGATSFREMFDYRANNAVDLNNSPNSKVSSLSPTAKAAVALVQSESEGEKTVGQSSLTVGGLKPLNSVLMKTTTVEVDSTSASMSPGSTEVSPSQSKDTNSQPTVAVVLATSKKLPTTPAAPTEAVSKVQKVELTLAIETAAAQPVMDPTLNSSSDPDQDEKNLLSVASLLESPSPKGKGSSKDLKGSKKNQVSTSPASISTAKKLPAPMEKKKSIVSAAKTKTSNKPVPMNRRTSISKVPKVVTAKPNVPEVVPQIAPVTVLMPTVPRRTSSMTDRPISAIRPITPIVLRANLELNEVSLATELKPVTEGEKTVAEASKDASKSIAEKSSSSSLTAPDSNDPKPTDSSSLTAADKIRVLPVDTESTNNKSDSTSNQGTAPLTNRRESVKDSIPNLTLAELTKKNLQVIDAKSDMKKSKKAASEAEVVVSKAMETERSEMSEESYVSYGSSDSYSSYAVTGRLTGRSDFNPLSTRSVKSARKIKSKRNVMSARERERERDSSRFNFDSSSNNNSPMKSYSTTNSPLQNSRPFETIEEKSVETSNTSDSVTVLSSIITSSLTAMTAMTAALEPETFVPPTEKISEEPPGQLGSIAFGETDSETSKVLESLQAAVESSPSLEIIQIDVRKQSPTIQNKLSKDKKSKSDLKKKTTPPSVISLKKNKSELRDITPQKKADIFHQTSTIKKRRPRSKSPKKKSATSDSEIESSIPDDIVITSEKKLTDEVIVKLPTVQIEKEEKIIENIEKSRSDEEVLEKTKETHFTELTHSEIVSTELPKAFESESTSIPSTAVVTHSPEESKTVTVTETLTDADIVSLTAEEMVSTAQLDSPAPILEMDPLALSTDKDLSDIIHSGDKLTSSRIISFGAITTMGTNDDRHITSGFSDITLEDHELTDRKETKPQPIFSQSMPNLKNHPFVSTKTRTRMGDLRSKSAKSPVKLTSFSLPPTAVSDPRTFPRIKSSPEKSITQSSAKSSRHTSLFVRRSQTSPTRSKLSPSRSKSSPSRQRLSPLRSPSRQQQLEDPSLIWKTITACDSLYHAKLVRRRILKKVQAMQKSMFTEKDGIPQSLRLDIIEFAYSGIDIHDIIRLRIESSLKWLVETTSGFVIKAFELTDTDLDYDLIEKTTEKNKGLYKLMMQKVRDFKMIDVMEPASLDR